MRERVNIGEVSKLEPDYMGFIFYSKSPRFVGEDFVMPELPGKIKKVGVFVNASTEEMISAVEKYGLDYLQLHGNESIEKCRELRAGGIKVIKVFSVDEQMDFQLTKRFKDVVDFFLFDTKGKYYGGNAMVFNWSMLERYDQSVPFFLSGGIGPGNIREVRKLEGMNLLAVDVNSGVEDSPGFKNTSKVEEVKRVLDKSDKNI